MQKIIEYAKLARLHSAVLSGLTPVLGALAVRGAEISILGILFLAGFCTHIFGFVLNEYMDVDIDSKSKLLKDKPLVKGTISKNAAIYFAASGVILGYLLIGYIFIIQGYLPIIAIVFFTLSWLAVGLYDLTSKSIFGSDILLALWTGSLCLFGGFAVTQSPHPLLFIIAGLAFLQLFIQNLLAGLKDLIQDKLGFGTSTPLRMGALIKTKKLIVPNKFQIYIYSLKIIHLLLVFIPFILLWLSFNLVQMNIIIILLIFNFLLVFRIFNSPVYNRAGLLRAIGLHEIISYSVVPIMLFGIISIETIIILIILPIVWLAVLMTILFGRLLPTI